MPPKKRKPYDTPNTQLKTVRYRNDLWERLKDFAASRRPRVTITAVLEAALEEYLDKHQKEQP